MAMQDPKLFQTLRDHPAFFRFWISRLSSAFGFQMLSVAVGWQIYDITGSALDLGLIGLAQFIPALVLAIPAGHIADQFNRRRVAVICQSGEWLFIALLAAGSLLNRLDESTILLLICIISVFRTVASPSSRSMVPALVPPAILPKALAINASGGQTASIAGPALGGLLYLAGPTCVYTTTAVLYLVSITMLARLNYQYTVPPRRPLSLSTLFGGITFIRSNPVLLGVLSLDLFAVLLGGATALLPMFARDILHTGPEGLGLLRSAPAVGALLMSLALAQFSLRRHVGMTMFAAVAGFGIATIVFALSTSLWLSLAALFLLGAFDMISMVIRSTLVQLETPDTMRGRVNAVNGIFINTSNQLGEFESGIAAALMGAVGATLFGGIGTLLVVGLWMWMFPQIRKRQQLVTREE